MSEPINEEDLDWLTRVENRISAMRKRENEHHPKSFTESYMTGAIKEIHQLRQMLQARFEKKVDADL